ncbi:hypothetical protein WR25_19457 [Diploscapter pachys]|uniref:Potassium channel domain-containing protein n=1 Tax=Diploscapter pachys TaxID=2018661 RepID=A0A2A2KL64_9BILA|nr:hypothetical protein WR25_19457 [Diploscapter pachys]
MPTNEENDENWTNSQETTTRETTDTNKCAKMLKMALPHVGIALLLFFYLVMGAAVFQYVEYDADVEIQKSKLARIKQDYKKIIDEIRSLADSEKQYKAYEPQMFQTLSKLSSLHEGRSFQLDPELKSEDALPPRWSKSSAFLYALSILASCSPRYYKNAEKFNIHSSQTTTGYAYAVPVTPLGQIIAIAYGLFGIPIMVLAAVDIGKFLSHIVLTIYAKYLQMVERIKKVFKHDIPARTRSLRKCKESAAGEETEVEKESSEEETPKEEERRLPLIINASILLIFCMFGGVTYIAAGGKATFLEAFFVTFNLVANLTMSEMPSDLNHMLTIIYIFVFVTFGVAVLSMSAELAASELKELFLKIHYFGRKINFTRTKKEKQLDVSEVEVKELLKIIEEIRRKYPEKISITPLDILQYMHEHSMENILTEHKDERRDTIAFMPETMMEMLKFADEMDMDDHRSLGQIETQPLIDRSEVNGALDCSGDEELERRLYAELRKYTKKMNQMNLLAEG